MKQAFKTCSSPDPARLQTFSYLSTGASLRVHGSSEQSLTSRIDARGAWLGRSFSLRGTSLWQTKHMIMEVCLIAVIAVSWENGLAAAVLLGDAGARFKG